MTRLGSVVAAAALLTCPAAARGGGQTRQPLLAVPYVAQQELLCGGAAAAMVLRYWGARRDATDYADLVEPERQGIPAVALVAALREDGWLALPFAGSAESLRDHLDAGRPVVVLVEVRPGRYHYVVVVAWIDRHVVLHDPAIGPYQVLAEDDFVRAWAKTGSWSLLVLPVAVAASSDGKRDAGEIGAAASDEGERPSPAEAGGSAPESDQAADACAPLLESAIDAARAGDTAVAEARFDVAMVACPRSPAPARELGGLRFRQQRWTEAASLARRALSLDPSDRYTRRLLASARFLAGDRDGALDDWNGVREPRVDLVEIQGLTRTRHPVVGRLLALRGGDLLTRETLVRARRRLSELPVASLTRLRYEAPQDGRAKVVAAVVERPPFPRSPLAIGAAVARAAVTGEAAVQLAGPTGAGVTWTPWWRWGDGRTGAGVSLSLPAPAGVGAVWGIDAYRDQERFAWLPFDAVERTHVGLTIADWFRADTRWELGSGWDRWRARGQHLFVGGAIERRLAADHLALRLDGSVWTPVGAGRGAFTTAGASLAWRSAAEDVGSLSTWYGIAGARMVGGEAPLDLWPGAGQGELRAPLLRAHPLVENDSIRPGGVGRSLPYGTLEYRRRLARLGPIGLSGALFTDIARIGSPAAAPGTPSRTTVLELDTGAGLRLRLPGQPGLLRVDLAKGLLDGATSVSAGWILDPWR